MGLQGPLTAQALGRSPYDPEMVQGEGEGEGDVEGENDVGSPASRQQYDARGRPINPESKRINRDIIRSHNEVMLLVGVAEAENQPSAAENESRRQHDAYENALGARLTFTGTGGSGAPCCVTPSPLMRARWRVLRRSSSVASAREGLVPWARPMALDWGSMCSGCASKCVRSDMMGGGCVMLCPCSRNPLFAMPRFPVGQVLYLKKECSLPLCTRERRVYLWLCFLLFVIIGNFFF